MIRRFSLDIGSKKLVANCSHSLEAQAYWILKTIGCIENTLLRDGFKIEIGFPIFSIHELNSDLVICEPDFENNPFIKTREDIS